jgi:hypothetical protein
MSEELKACPFCGKDAMHGNDDCYDPFDTACFLYTPGTKSIELWNTRPLEDALQAKLDACELALDDMRLGRAIADNKLDIARESFHLILDGKPGVNLSNDYLRGWDIGIAEETLRKLGG